MTAGEAPRTVGVVTGSRADYGLLRPTIAALHDDPRFELRLLVTAMHLDPGFGLTVREIEADPWPIVARIPLSPGDDLGGRLAEGVAGFAGTLAEARLDLLLLLGDRHEMLSAALAATGLGLPIAHMHGGELSEGSLDDAMRHCITKLAHVHLPAARAYAERLCQLGEEPERVHIVGAAGLEAICELELLTRSDLAEALGGIALDEPLVALTFHPASLEPGAAEEQVTELVAAVESAFDERGTVVMTMPNDDPGNAPVRKALQSLAERRDTVHAFESLGQLRYLSLLSHADAVLGNSSSAIIEAPAFRLPTVNIGARQQGRLAQLSTIDCPAERGAITEAIEAALDPAFRRSLDGMENPYGDGRVSSRVLEVLATVRLDRALRHKRFLDLPDGRWREELAFGSGPS